MTLPRLHPMHLAPKIESYVKERIAEENQISKDRQEELSKLARYIKACREAGKQVKLLFVCTHNSRRSHMAQLWAKIGAVYFGIDKLESYSGGTETTAMNPRTVAALQRAGLEIKKEDRDRANPHYEIWYSNSEPAEVCFSKRLNDAPNPTEGFAAIMTCSDADASCPTVKGCEIRLALPYEDPKVSDGTTKEAAIYDAKSKEIAREMLFVMSRVAKPL
jgi:arsenate reductase (thioredoxin)